MTPKEKCLYSFWAWFSSLSDSWSDPDRAAFVDPGLIRGGLGGPLDGDPKEFTGDDRFVLGKGLG